MLRQCLIHRPVYPPPYARCCASALLRLSLVLILRLSRARLHAPQVLHQCLIHPNMSVRGALEEAGAYVDIEDMVRGSGWE